MEPDVLASRGESVSRETDWAARIQVPVAGLPAESVSMSAAPSFPAVVPETNGMQNGHSRSPNGHAHAMSANGHDHAYGDARSWVAVTGGGSSAAWVEGGSRALESAASYYLRFGKRALDLVGAAVALVFCAPVLLAAAIAIKFESRGPVFYRSTRIGRGGRPFTFYKMRSMVNGADQHRHHLSHLNEADGPVFKINGDPRVTRVGRFLRSTSIDEVPQFFHVLTGEMSLVGPRPPLPEEVGQYEPWQRHRLDVRPGLTCLWQISGRSRIGFQEWMRLDLEYIRRRSLALDLQILLRTIPAVISREGAY